MSGAVVHCEKQQQDPASGLARTLVGREDQSSRAGTAGCLVSNQFVVSKMPPKMLENDDF